MGIKAGRDAVRDPSDKGIAEWLNQSRTWVWFEDQAHAEPLAVALVHSSSRLSHNEAQITVRETGRPAF